MATTQKSSAYSQEQLDEMDIVVNETLGTMLQLEAELTGKLAGTSKDSTYSKRVSAILQLRADIDLLISKYDRFLTNKVALSPPSPEMIGTAVGFAEELARVATSQNRFQALLDLSVKVLNSSNQIMTA